MKWSGLDCVQWNLLPMSAQEVWCTLLLSKSNKEEQSQVCCEWKKKPLRRAYKEPVYFTCPCPCYMSSQGLLNTVHWIVLPIFGILLWLLWYAICSCQTKFLQFATVYRSFQVPTVCIDDLHWFSFILYSCASTKKCEMFHLFFLSPEYSTVTSLPNACYALYTTNFMSLFSFPDL